MTDKKRILVIDDDHEVRSILCENLRDCGYVVREAHNGAVGLMMIETEPMPDLIITDIIMPEKEGIETIREIRKMHAHVKVIAISGGGRTESGDFLEMARKVGADTSIPKPISMPVLEATIKKLVA